MDKLLNCPFCGDGVEVRSFVKDGGQDDCKIECYGCGIFMENMPKKEITIAWNKRNK